MRFSPHRTRWLSPGLRLAYGLCLWMGIELATAANGAVTDLWLPAAMAFLIVLHQPYRGPVSLYLTSFTIYWLAPDAGGSHALLWQASLSSLGELLRAVVAYICYQRLLRPAIAEDAASFIRCMAMVALVFVPLCTWLVIASLYTGGLLEARPLSVLWQQAIAVITGNLVGIMVAVALLLAFEITPGFWERAGWRPGLGGLLLLTAAVCFVPLTAIGLLVLPLMLGCAVYDGMRGTALSLLVLSLMLPLAYETGWGAFGGVAHLQACGQLYLLVAGAQGQ